MSNGNRHRWQTQSVAADSLVIHILLDTNSVSCHHCAEVTVPKGFPKRLMQAREARGLGVNELQRRADLGSGQVSRYEFGDRAKIPAHYLGQLADALGVSLDWLWFGRGEMNVSHLSPLLTFDEFETALDERGLRLICKKHGKRWKLATIARALILDLKSDANGEPEGGWVEVLDAIEDGKYDITFGDSTAVEVKTAKATAPKRKRRKPRQRAASKRRQR